MAEVRQLRYFVAAAERLSFSQAALDLHISQPALSEAIAKLETELGVQLLERSTRRVSLTVAGEALLHEGRQTLDVFEQALLRAQQAARGQAGLLRVGFEATGAGPLNSRARARRRGRLLLHRVVLDDRVLPAPRPRMGPDHRRRTTPDCARLAQRRAVSPGARLRSGRSRAERRERALIRSEVAVLTGECPPGARLEELGEAQRRACLLDGDGVRVAVVEEAVDLLPARRTRRAGRARQASLLRSAILGPEFADEIRLVTSALRGDAAPRPQRLR